ncbi:MAG: DUF4906 domain-containing protein [Bacteroidales bacterium]|nr:DUF4906 domain-containing protein [Bacteroidales bacterium]
MKTGIIIKYAAAIVSAACLAVSLISCSIDAEGTTTGQPSLNIFLEDDGISRSSFQAEEENMPDNVLLLFYNLDGSLAFYATHELDFESGEACLINNVPVNREYLIYALAGVDYEDEEVESIFGTVSAAEAFTVSKGFIQSASAIPLAHIPERSLLIRDGGCYDIPLRRILAKYNFRLDKSSMSGTFTATSLTVKQSPLFMHPLLESNAATSPASLSEGDAATSREVRYLNQGRPVTCYLLENCQGEVCPGNGDPWGKVPENMAGGTGSLATYVEICGDYTCDSVSISGLKYRFFLGSDATANCDVRRNTVNTVTLSLTDENTVLKESWKVVRGEVTTRYLELSPSAPQAIAAGGTLPYCLLLHSVTNGIDDGGTDVTSDAGWYSSNPSAATVSGGIATGCNTTENALQTTITATYGSLTASGDLTVNGQEPATPTIIRVRLEITSITITDAHHSVTYTNGYLPPAVYTPGDDIYLDGERSEWCRIVGGTYSDTDATITVKLYVTPAGGTEQLASTQDFTFGAMRDDIIPFTEEDWPGIFAGSAFSFEATIYID